MTEQPPIARPAMTPSQWATVEAEVLDDLEQAFEGLGRILRARGGGPLARLDGLVRRASLVIAGAVVAGVRRALAENEGPTVAEVADEVRRGDA